MTLPTATRLGPYEILEPLGSGGMGEVYRARDTRLDRDVAVKVLPPHLVESAEARSRFEREAKAVAALSHPNILAIHDFGRENDTAYAVTELLDGETLAERLTAGPLPVRKALELSSQMAEGLAAAHEKGIVHRDLKPANVFLTADGRLKILDFGLAKTGVTDDGHTQMATMGEATDPGTVLGTSGYMSPEQVRAEPADHRSDIFSFGSVLYEMLTAKRAFARESAVETMSAVLQEDPQEISSINPSIPGSVDRILHRCLEKKPDERFQSARDLAFALGNTGESSSRALPALDLPDPARPSRLRRWFPGLGFFVLGALAGALVTGRVQAPVVSEPVKVTPLTHTGKDWAPSASPDGRMIAFTSDRDGRPRIWLRQMKGGIEAPLTEGTDGSPRFSPDGSSVLFLRNEGTQTSVYRTPVVGGQPRKILDGAMSADWSPDGSRIAFVRAVGEEGDELVVGTADVQTGQARELTRTKGQFLYGLRWSPDGRWLSASVTSAVLYNLGESLLLIDAESGEIRETKNRDVRISGATWSRSAKSLLFAESTSLLGDISSPIGRVIQLDPHTGKERTLFWVQSVHAGGSDFVSFDFLGTQSLIYDEIRWRGSLTEIDLDGEPPYGGGRRFAQGNSRDRQPAYSPDGDLVIFSSNRSGNLDLWTVNTQSGDVRQLTDDDAEDWDPAFSADGESILWSSSRGGHLEIWMAGADGSGAHQVTNDGRDAENPTQTPDGRWIVYVSGNLERNGIWKIRTDGSEERQLDSGALLVLPEVSPDGKYVVYSMSDPKDNITRILVVETDSAERVFETDVAFMGYQNVVSPGRARWMPDGRSIVFVGTDETGLTGLFAQDFRPGEDTIDTRRKLVGFTSEHDVESFGISPDGKRLTLARIDHFRSLKLAEGITLE